MILSDPVRAYLDTFCANDLSYVNILEAAKVNKVPVINQAAASFMQVLLKIKKPQKICELGTGYGLSTLYILESVSNNAIIHSVDASINAINFCNEEFKKRGVERRINLYHMPAKDFLDDSIKKGEKYDFFFVDAVKKEYLDYLERIIQLASFEALLIFDNVLWKGEILNKNCSKAKNLNSFNKFFMQHSKFKTEILPIGDGLGVGIFLG